MTEIKTNQYSDKALYETLKAVLALFYDNKPDERSVYSRHFAVTITELEKTVAYFKAWIIDAEE